MTAVWPVRRGDAPKAAGAAPLPKVAVVGGGLAGAAAALACADAGAAVTVFEAAPFLGGAASSVRRDGLTIDRGQHVFLRCCTAYRAFLDRIEATRLTRLQDRLDIPVLRPADRPARLRRLDLPAPLHLSWALASYRFLTPRERFKIVGAVLALRRLAPKAAGLDDQALGTWLADHGQSADAIRLLWDLFIVSTLNAVAADASLALAVKVLRTGLLEHADAADIGVSRVPLSQLHGDQVAGALQRAGVEVRLRAGVRALRSSSGRTQIVARSGEVIDADAVILAVPHDHVGALLPPEARAGAPDYARLGSSPIVNVHVVYDRPVIRFGFAAAVDSPVQWVFDRSESVGLRQGRYLALSLSAADAFIDEPAERLRRLFVPAIATLLPAARAAQVEWFAVTRDRHATFRQGAGSGRLRPGPVTSVPNLFLAGAWTDTGWPATMESAVRSGVLAARYAMTAVGRGQSFRAGVME